MAKPPEKKPPPSKPPELRVQPMQLQIGDRLTDETSEYKVIGRMTCDTRIAGHRWASIKQLGGTRK
jgi:hypothetical protein